MACLALSNLVKLGVGNRGNLARCSAAGGVEVLIELLNQHCDMTVGSVSLLQYACEALGNLALSDAVTRAKCDAARGLEAVTNVVRLRCTGKPAHCSPTAQAMLSVACGVIRVLVGNSDADARAQCVAQCAAAGAVEALAAVLQRHAATGLPSMLENACGVLASVANHGEPYKARCVAAGCVEGAVAVLRRLNAVVEPSQVVSSRRVQVMACWMLRNLISDATLLADSTRTRARARALSAGCLEETVRMLRRLRIAGPAGLQQHGLALLKNVIFCNRKNAQRCLAIGGKEVVLGILEAYRAQGIPNTLLAAAQDVSTELVAAETP